MDNLNFDELLNIVKEKNKIEGEKCLICHFPDKKENLLKLKCSHYFHLRCLVPEDFDITKKNFRSICPYCGQKVLIKKKTMVSSESDKSNVTSKSTPACQCYELKKSNTCKVILKSGINKGKECGRINCKYHKSS